MLRELRNLDVDGAELDELVAGVTFGKALLATFTENRMQPPEWLADKMDKAGALIATKRRENLQRALKEAEARRAGLATAEERRQRENELIEKLKAELAAG